VGLVTKDRISDVVEMRHRGVIEKQRVLQLARIADYALVPNNDVFPKIGIVAKFAIAANDGRAFDHHPIFDDGAFADKNLLADIGDAMAPVVEGGAEMAKKERFDSLESFPGILAAFKNCHVFGLAEVEQIRRLEHASIVTRGMPVSTGEGPQ
jgi:hypothetical protein